MRLILIDPKEELCSAWEEAFSKHPEVEIRCGYFESVESFDCMVSAANSFGLMDGGVDLAIINFFGEELEKRVQRHIINEYFGEQPIGTSFIFPTHHSKHPFIAHTPTMRTPMAITGTDYVYLAMKAILTLIKSGVFEDGTPVQERIQSVAIPGLGTGVGQVPPLLCARQMRIAWEDVIQEKYLTEEGWEELRSNYAYFFTHDDRDLKYDIP